MVHCCISKCSNRCSKKTQRQQNIEKQIGYPISFIRFPKSHALRTAWFTVLKDIEWNPLNPFDATLICIEHFSEDRVYVSEKGRRIPRKGSIPTIFPPQGPQHKPGVNYCSAINCKANAFIRPDLSFFKFPKDPSRCMDWVQKCHRLDLKDKEVSRISKSYRLCSLHFTEDMFVGTKKMHPKRRLLKDYAIPTIFNGPCSIQKELPKVTEISILEKGQSSFMLPESCSNEEAYPSVILPQTNLPDITPSIFLISDNLSPQTTYESIPDSDFINLVTDSATPTFQLPFSEESSDSLPEKTPSDCDDNDEDMPEIEFNPSDYVYPVGMEPDSPEDATGIQSPVCDSPGCPDVMIASIPNRRRKENLRESCRAEDEIEVETITVLDELSETESEITATDEGSEMEVESSATIRMEPDSLEDGTRVQSPVCDSPGSPAVLIASPPAEESAEITIPKRRRKENLRESCRIDSDIEVKSMTAANKQSEIEIVNIRTTDEWSEIGAESITTTKKKESEAGVQTIWETDEGVKSSDIEVQSDTVASRHEVAVTKSKKGVQISKPTNHLDVSSTSKNDVSTTSKNGRPKPCHNCAKLSQANELLANDYKVKVETIKELEKALKAESVLSERKDGIINYLKLEVVELRKELDALGSKKYRYIYSNT